MNLGFLDVVFVPLLFAELDRGFLGIKLEVRALKVVGTESEER